MAKAQPLLGKTISYYRIVKKLGGDMGVDPNHSFHRLKGVGYTARGDGIHRG